ncbi:MAG: prolipoprotein diacylglyceryl transferase [Deltaproteobacteria bacterium]|nr:prolipoprotein diacylglyceryl transferase [Deltaproteobacteria bacterium]
MWPTLFTIGDALPVHTWGVMITLAFLAAALTAQARADRAGVDGDRLVGLYLVTFLAGLLGSRLLHFTMAEPQRFFRDPLIYLRFWEGGFAFWGGVILGGAAAVFWARWRGLPVWAVTDLLAPVVMLGLAIGRIGCFFAGCCHGRACAVPEGAVNLLPEDFSGGALWVSTSPPFLVEMFHNGVGLRDTPMLPTHLWESAAAFLLFLVLSWAWRRRRHDGQVFGLLLVLYAPVRAFLEVYRGDTVRGVGWFGALSTSQLVGIPMLVLGILVILLRARASLTPPRAAPTDEDLLDDEGS